LASGGWRDYRETNPVLGPRPTVGQVDTYTALAAVTTLGIASVMPPKTRRWFLAAASAVEVYALAGMAHAGVSIRVF
jgi:putative copper export protein